MKQNRTALWSTTSLGEGRYEAIFWLAAALLVGAIMMAYVPRFAWYGYYTDAVSSSWDELTDRPFAYRALVPLLIEVARQIVPAKPEVYFGAIQYLSLLGFVAALRSMAHLFWVPSRYLDYIVLASIPLITPMSFYQQQIYDMTMLCLFTWGMVWLAQRRWTAFLFVYALACFNKETTLFLTLIFIAIHYRDLGQRLYQKILLMQLSIYLIVRAALMIIFRNRPGGVVEYHLQDHLTNYIDDPVLTIAYLIALAVVIFLVSRQFNRKPLFLRTVLLSVLPCMLVLYVFFGYPYEIRVFYEIYGPLLLLCIPPHLLKAQQP